MAKPMKGLGRGMDAIFADNETHNGSEKMMLRTADIEPNRGQPRTDFDQNALEELASSIALHGVLQPIIVRPVENGFYQIIAGERRWRASKMAGLSEMPAIVIDADEKKAAEIALIENLQREDLNAVEEALAYRSLLNDFSLTQDELAKRIGKSRSALTNTLRLLELPDEVLALVSDKTLSPGHARTLLALENSEDIPLAVQRVIGRGLSVRSTEEMVKTLNARAGEEKKKEKKETLSVGEVDYQKDLEDRVSAKLGRRFRLAVHKGVKVCELAYEDTEDLETLLTLLCGKDFSEEI